MTVDVHPHRRRRREEAVDSAAPRRRFNKAAVYRQCRMLHTYISAFAFLTLMFFAVTGLTLNHPEWFGSGKAAVETVTVQISPDRMAAARAAADPARALGHATEAVATLRGAYASGEVVGDEAFLRYEGATGASDVVVDLTAGTVEVETRRATAMALLNDLHRGKNVGAVWRTFIDVSAVLIAVLSLLGYVLFFSLRLRLATSLRLTALGVIAMGGMIWLFVP